MTRLKIEDGLPKELSRQRRWQLRQKQKQCCQRCGKKTAKKETNCDKCKELKRKEYYEKRQSKNS